MSFLKTSITGSGLKDDALVGHNDKCNAAVSWRGLLPRRILSGLVSMAVGRTGQGMCRRDGQASMSAQLAVAAQIEFIRRPGDNSEYC